MSGDDILEGLEDAGVGAMRTCYGLRLRQLHREPKSLISVVVMTSPRGWSTLGGAS